MKALKVIIAVLLIGAIVLLSFSCSSSTTSTTKTITATVKKGNVTLAITGTGNLALARTQDLAFEVAGTVQSVSVSVGDAVTSGETLAALDTSARDDLLENYQKALETAQRNLSTMQANVTKAQRAITTVERNVTDKQSAITQAQLDVQTAEDAFSQITDIKTAHDKVTADQNNIDNAQMNLGEAAAVTGNLDAVTYWQQMVKYYQTVLAQDQADLNDLLSGSSVKESNNVNLQIQQLQLNIEQKKKALVDVQNAIDDARAAVDDANDALANVKLDEADAAQAVSDAQAKIDDTNNENLIITAPFDGFVTAVKVSGGQEVQKGTVAVIIADPDQFEANILVTENDIYSVTVGQEAEVVLDALPDVTFPAKVTSIAPTATVSSGVVNYQVVIGLTSSSTTQAAGLKDGLSATVDIISQQAAGVLVVPNKALSKQGPNTTVQVVNGTTTETRSVQTGLTDGTYTAVTQGLTENDQIIYVIASSSSSSSSASASNGNALQGLTGGGPDGGGPPPGGF
jgi:HlyD family secretion protein